MTITQELIDAERVKFEADLQRRVSNFTPEILLERRADGKYASLLSQYSWEAWQAAISQQAVQDGYVLVPKEPTEEMVEAGNNALSNAYLQLNPTVLQIYKAMIAAAPSDNKALVESEPIGYGVKNIDCSFKFDALNQQHTPTLMVEFEPVPVGADYHALPWLQRDNLAKILLSGTTPADTVKQDAPKTVVLDVESNDYQMLHMKAWNEYTKTFRHSGDEGVDRIKAHKHGFKAGMIEALQAK